ncbi:hypothetical protein PHYBLDRAFT_175681 [Phycomyces blakesleeanus NRRL 1555(-)]|uniref:Uncharacterized protein n=1 Tax=Phycomyces blakesleeanus (strain ATCC 8743b / DSM 1359 / FGSC 10004 / NBRC 33097 / NRRL 1555) TaxID=763407 RepID=A0A162TC40_PHYB8|nr:hypothetical protein PHYBLDRAFT_175681 [Phycomyces blakesleeanus NRRL 1555(-)]OAD65943.1 hypothetical protein PHYBLDRAFT_175681 [Phycomyces blakesleeanus NRRL 1555(-)]|eukprot:XP_018283983.1 hypothetical protein PHYBLDRAFT_175681 [Phycomyces blakesleeanus NRRL 1555(-)]
MAVHNTLSSNEICGYASAGTGFKKENITVVIGFNFDSAAKLVLVQVSKKKTLLCAAKLVLVQVSKKENDTVVISFNLDSVANLVLVQVSKKKLLCGEASVGTGFKKENITVGITVDFEGGVKRLLVQV